MSTVESPLATRVMNSLTRSIGRLSPMRVWSPITSTRSRWFSARRESNFDRFSSVTAATRETALRKKACCSPKDSEEAGELR
jgi:hypothetical protein